MESYLYEYHLYQAEVLNVSTGGHGSICAGFSVTYLLPVIAMTRDQYSVHAADTQCKTPIDKS